MYNRKISINDDVVEIIIYRSRSTKTILCDIDDYDRIKSYTWGINEKGYAISCIDGRNVRMHRLILNIIDSREKIVDHINGNKLDNRKCNLRIATHTQSLANRRGWGKLKYKGVSIETKIDKCGYVYNQIIAHICVKNKRIRLGSYKSIEDAARIYDSAARYYFGEYAKLNFPNDIPDDFNLIIQKLEDIRVEYETKVQNVFITRQMIFDIITKLLERQDTICISDIKNALLENRPNYDINSKYIQKKLTGLLKQWYLDGSLKRKWYDDSPYTWYVYWKV